MAILKRIAGQFSRLSVCLSVLHCSLDGHRKGLVLENEISFLACQIVFSIIVFRFHLLDQYFAMEPHIYIPLQRSFPGKSIARPMSYFSFLTHISPRKKNERRNIGSAAFAVGGYAELHGHRHLQKIKKPIIRPITSDPRAAGNIS